MLHSSSSVTFRQQQRRQQRGQLNKSVLVALVCVALGAVGVARWQNLRAAAQIFGQRALVWTADQGFIIQNLQVVGRHQVSTDFILQGLQAKPGTPILAYCPQDAAARLLANPWLRSVNVERRLPNTVLVRIDERVPAARWQVDGKLAVVDVTGVVLTTENMGLYQDLPIIIGQQARSKVVDLFTLLHGEPDLAAQVVAATWVSNRRWDLTLRNGVVVKLPVTDATQALSAFAALDKQDHILARDIMVVDLRLPAQVTLRPTIRANVLIERPDFSDTPDVKKKSI